MVPPRGLLFLRFCGGCVFKCENWRSCVGKMVRSDPNLAPNFPKLFEDFLCFIFWETATTKNSPKIPAIFQCQIPKQT